jgi:hypothetical protein
MALLNLAWLGLAWLGLAWLVSFGLIGFIWLFGSVSLDWLVSI